MTPVADHDPAEVPVPATTVAACLIVRDEATRLGRCLASLRGAVDEVVVCDTGSCDSTVDIARRFGATTTSAAWRDDFAHARNAALACCTSNWVLAVDADEELVTSGAPLAAFLASVSTGTTCVLVTIEHAGGGDAWGLAAHDEIKLFRRGAASWNGRVHERLVTADGPLVAARALPPEVAHLVHHGYVDAEVVRLKATRNARLARIELAEMVASGAAEDDVTRVALDLGRSCLGAGERADAVDTLQRVRTRDASGPYGLVATDLLARVALEDGRSADTLSLVAELRSRGAPPAWCTWLEALAHTQAGDLGLARDDVARLTSLVDILGRHLDRAKLTTLREYLSSAERVVEPFPAERHAVAEDLPGQGTG